MVWNPRIVNKVYSGKGDTVSSSISCHASSEAHQNIRTNSFQASCLNTTVRC